MHLLRCLWYEWIFSRLSWIQTIAIPRLKRFVSNYHTWYVALLFRSGPVFAVIIRSFMLYPILADKAICDHVMASAGYSRNSHYFYEGFSDFFEWVYSRCVWSEAVPIVFYLVTCADWELHCITWDDLICRRSCTHFIPVYISAFGKDELVPLQSIFLSAYDFCTSNSFFLCLLTDFLWLMTRNSDRWPFVF